MIRTIAVAALIAPAIAHAQCKGMTYSDNFQNGDSAWQSTMSAGDTSTINPSHASVAPSGLTLNTNPSGGSWLENANFWQTYGTFRATVDVSQGMLASGMTSAVWLLAKDRAPGSNQSWPAEIDFWETAGGTFDTAMHSGFTSDNAGFWDYNISPGPHTVTVDWQPDTITWFLDNKQVQQRPTPPDFNTPMHFILDAMNQGGGASGSMTVQSVQAFDNLQDANACSSASNLSGNPFTGNPSNQQQPSPPVATGGWNERDVVCTSADLPTASINPAVPPPPATAEGMVAFQAAGRMKDQGQSFILAQQSVLCDLQDGLGRLLAIQAAQQAQH